MQWSVENSELRVSEPYLGPLTFDEEKSYGALKKGEREDV